MNHKKEIPLKIELFSDGDDNPFRIRSKREILSLLQGIAQERMRAVLYYGEKNDFILTKLLGASEHGIWMDIGPLAEDNQRILQSNKIIFISSHRQVKIQFIAHRIERASFNHVDAFHLPLPDSLLRIQRRDYFRLTTPVNKPLRCTIPVRQAASTAQPGIIASKHEVTIMDISVGGIALACEEHDTELQPGKTYEGCKISLPDIGVITVTVKVKNVFEITLRNGLVNKRVGCEFINMGGEAATLLQRYVTQLQSQAIAKTRT
jgi:flagellar brake protein